MLCELQAHIGKCLNQAGGSVKPMGVLQKLKSKLMHPELFHISMYVTSDIKAHKTNKVTIVHSCIIGLPATIDIYPRFII